MFDPAAQRMQEPTKYGDSMDHRSDLTHQDVGLCSKMQTWPNLMEISPYLNGDLINQNYVLAKQSGDLYNDQ